MGRFYFKVEDGRPAEPLEVELPDEAEARIEAAALVGDLLRDKPAALWATDNWRVVVEGENGEELFVVQAMAKDTRADGQFSCGN